MCYEETGKDRFLTPGSVQLGKKYNMKYSSYQIRENWSTTRSITKYRTSFAVRYTPKNKITYISRKNVVNVRVRVSYV